MVRQRDDAPGSRPRGTRPTGEFALLFWDGEEHVQLPAVFAYRHQARRAGLELTARPWKVRVRRLDQLPQQGRRVFGAGAH